MSRRKQSNPKPLKRHSESEGDDDEIVDEKLSPVDDNESEKNDVSNGGHLVSVDGKEIHIKLERLTPSPGSEGSSRDLNETNDVFLRNNIHEMKSSLRLKQETSEKREIRDPEIEHMCLKNVCFPNDVLYLKKVSEKEVTSQGRSYLVCSAIPLQSGSSIGPFAGELVSLSGIQATDLVLQAQTDQGEASFVKVLEKNGAWLSLLRPAPNKDSQNAAIVYEGGRLWCTLTKSIDVGVEIVACFTVAEETPESPGAKEEPEEDNIPDSPAENGHSPLLSSATIMPKERPNHAALLFGCPFCGVRFSSARTLDGHLTYYCSKKPSDFPQHQPQGTLVSPGGNGEDGRADTSRKRRHDDSPEKGLKKEPVSPPSDPEETPSANKLPKVTDNIRCPLCSYTADKISSLNRHMRIHSRGGNLGYEALTKPVAKYETYCRDCNIQFSSSATYRGHKEFYCRGKTPEGSQRAERGPTRGDPDASLSPTASSSSSSSSKQPMSSSLSAASLLEMTGGKFDLHSLMASSSFLGGHPRVIFAPPIVADDQSHSTSSGLNVQTVIVQPVLASSTAVSKTSPKISDARHNAESIVTSSTTSPSPYTSTTSNLATGEQPLDLSTSKKKDEEAEEGHMKQEPASPTGALNLSKSPAVSLKSEISRHSSSRESTPTPSPVISPGLLPPLISMAGLNLFGPKGMHHPLASVSKCNECNIVFYKRENYLIHKKHYCSSRRMRGNSPSVSSEESSTGALPVSGPPATRPSSTEPLPNGSLSSDENESRAKVVPGEFSIGPSSGPKSPMAGPSKGPSPLRVPEDVMYRFYCVPCRIKFSSASTLKAHQRFYCPYGQAEAEEQEQEGVGRKEGGLPDSGNHREPGDQGEGFHCERCDSHFLSGRLLKLHLCPAPPSPTLIRCPYCDFVSQTDMRISDHMKVHMPSKAYRCSICGYRGNTVRGMRMHGKLHVDNGIEYSDENMIEIEEPPVLPIMQTAAPPSGRIDLEAELIRLKNEPYKRRRSRKAYEKSEFMGVPAGERLATGERSTAASGSGCTICGQSFTDLATLALHMRLHEMAAIQALAQKPLPCQLCHEDFDSMEGLANHVHARHTKEEFDKFMDDRKPEISFSVSRHSPDVDRIAKETYTSDAGGDGKEGAEDTLPLRAAIKTEPVDPEEERMRTETVDENVDTGGGADDSHVSDGDKHKRRVQKELSNDVIIDVTPCSQSCRTGKESVLSPVSGPQSPNARRTSSSSPDQPKTPPSPSMRRASPSVKEEVTSPRNSVHPPHIPRFSEATAAMPFYQLLPSALTRFPQNLSLLSSAHAPLSLPGKGDKPSNGQHYCQHCEIGFRYMSTFLAHKKYYCTAKGLTEGESSPTPV